MADSVLRTVHSLAFSSDGRRVWAAHRDVIEICAWPSLDLLNLLPVKTSSLVGHPTDGLFAAVTPDGVLVLDEDGRVSARHPMTPLAVGFHEHGALTVLSGVRAPPGPWDVSVRTLEIGGDESHELNRCQLGQRRLWWPALLPSTKRAIFAMDDAPPDHWDVALGMHDDTWQFMGAQFTDHRSWLSVDVAADERAFAFSNKGSRTYVAWLSGTGEVEGTRLMEKRPFERQTIQKGPRRGAAHTFHPDEAVLLYVDISGDAWANDLYTGAIVHDYQGRFGGGYRWEG